MSNKKIKGRIEKPYIGEYTFGRREMLKDKKVNRKIIRFIGGIGLVIAYSVLFYLLVIMIINFFR